MTLKRSVSGSASSSGHDLKTSVPLPAQKEIGKPIDYILHLDRHFVEISFRPFKKPNYFSKFREIYRNLNLWTELKANCLTLTAEIEDLSPGIVAAISHLVLGVGVMNLCWKRCIGRRNEIDRGSRGSFTLKQIKDATNNFDPGNKIGEGSFGLPVYKGLLSEGTAIAVKQLRFKSKQENLEHVKEIRKLSTIRHPNLVKLYGCCIDGDRIFLVYEYLENNSLARALFGRDESQLKVDWPTRRKICIGVAEALAFIHGESRLKVDRDDLKATNVLLDKDLNSKVSDFRLAKLDHKKYTGSTISFGGSFGYMEPKYTVRGRPTDEVGIYSFGVVALEIISGISSSVHRPKEECLYLLDWARMLQEKGDLMDLVDPRLESNYIKDEILAMIDVALLCTNAPRTLRPTMSSLVSMLKGETSVEEYVSSTQMQL